MINMNDEQVNDTQKQLEELDNSVVEPVAEDASVEAFIHGPTGAGQSSSPRTLVCLIVALFILTATLCVAWYLSAVNGNELRKNLAPCKVSIVESVLVTPSFPEDVSYTNDEHTHVEHGTSVRGQIAFVEDESKLKPYKLVDVLDTVWGWKKFFDTKFGNFDVYCTDGTWTIYASRGHNQHSKIFKINLAALDNVEIDQVPAQGDTYEVVSVSEEKSEVGINYDGNDEGYDDNV
eukprot:1021018_1